MLQGLLQLVAAIAAFAAENISSMADGMKPDQGMLRILKISVDQHTGLLKLGQIHI
ncbi:hypothetical protein D3C76_1811990 [compost metagenome]